MSDIDTVGGIYSLCIYRFVCVSHIHAMTSVSVHPTPSDRPRPQPGSPAPHRARHAPAAARGPSVASDPAPAADGPVPMPSPGRRRSLMAVGRVVRPVSAPRCGWARSCSGFAGLRRCAPFPGPFPSRWRPLAPKARDPRGREETTGSEGVNDVVVVDPAAGELGRSPAESRIYRRCARGQSPVR